jgi:hypothetical protein
MRDIVVETLTHLGVEWQIVRQSDRERYFARYVRYSSDTGPFSTVEQAREFITATVAA